MDARSRYFSMIDGGVPPLPAALLVLAEAVDRCSPMTACDELSHAICMGIRHGIMGADAGNNDDVRDIRATVEMDQ